MLLWLQGWCSLPARRTGAAFAAAGKKNTVVVASADGR